MTDGTERDADLGRRLSALPIPDHRPGFWSELEAGLGAAAPEPSARRRPVGLVVLSVAALAAVVVGVFTFVDEPDHEVAITTPSTTASTAIAPTSTAAPLADVPAMLSGTYSVVEGGATTEYRFTRAIDGSYVMTNVRTGETVAYDAEAGRSIVWFDPDDGPAEVTITTGVGPGAPDRYPYTFVGGSHIEDFVASRATDKTGVGTVRPAPGFRPGYVWKGPVAVNQISGGGPDEIDVFVDDETFVIQRLVEKKGGGVLREIRAPDLEEHATIDRVRFRPAPPAGAEVTTESAGFHKSSVDALPSVGVIPPLHAERSGGPFGPPEGFELDSVWVNPDEPSPTGPEAGNPLADRITALVYRDGWRRVVVTLRDVEGPPDHWMDPFLGEGQMIDDTTVFELEADGAFAGARGDIVIDPQTVPHAWAISCGPDCTAANDWPGYVLTVSGGAGLAELRQFATVAIAA